MSPDHSCFIILFYINLKTIPVSEKNLHLTELQYKPGITNKSSEWALLAPLPGRFPDFAAWYSPILAG